MLDVILDSLKDTALLIPFLLAVHLLIELFEVKRLGKLQRSGVLSGAFAPLLGTGVALLPQCGFSVVASELYSKRYIRIGTLIAVFIATSDEALPILLGSAVTDSTVWAKLGLLIGIKVTMALVAGYALNFITRSRTLKKGIVEADLPHEHGCCGHQIGEKSVTAGDAPDAEETALSVGSVGETALSVDTANASEHAHSDQEEHAEHDHAHEAKTKKSAKEIFHTYFKHPLIHTLVITAFVFAVNFILGTIIFLAGGEEIFADFMSKGRMLQPLLAVLIGLIPNCAASVMITEMFVSGSLTLGAAVAGLAVNAGLGIAVLFRENKNLKENVGILIGLIVFALAVGYLLSAIGL